MSLKNSKSKSGSAKVNLWIDAGLFAIMMSVLSPKFTGLSIHEWLGIGIMAGFVIHLLLHWSWIIAALKNFIGNLPWQARINLLLNTLLFIDVVVVIFSGVLISREALPILNLALQGGRQWEGIHRASSNLSLIITALHLALHWKWVLNSLKRYVWQPIARIGQNQTPYPKQATLITVQQETK